MYAFRQNPVRRFWESLPAGGTPDASVRSDPVPKSQVPRKFERPNLPLTQIAMELK